MRFINHITGTVRDASRVAYELFSIMIPVIIVVKILKDLGWVSYIAAPLGPVMELVGLPASMGLVWGTGMVTNIYSAIVVYAALVSDLAQAGAMPSTAQVTVLCTMMLIAHSLPVELQIAKKSGVSLMGQAALRLVSAMVCGILLDQIFTRFGLLQQPSVMLWKPDPEAATLGAWAFGQCVRLFKIFLIINVLMGLMRVLEALRVTDLFLWFLSPFLKLMGVGKSAATITVVGLTLGISYGGGLIIHEARSGRVTRADLFASLSLMGLSHALVEDTLLMLLMGAHLAGTFWGRLLFSLVVVALLTRLYRRFAPNGQPESGEPAPGA